MGVASASLADPLRAKDSLQEIKRIIKTAILKFPAIDRNCADVNVVTFQAQLPGAIFGASLTLTVSTHPHDVGSDPGLL
jgi:hypothetical protein